MGKIKKSIAIIGCGKVGGSFAIALSKVKKWKITLNKVTKTPIEPIILKKKVPISNSLGEVLENAYLIFIAVKDNNISQIIESIKHQKVDIRGKHFLHFSGCLTSEVFLSLKNQYSIFAGSLHPIASFPSIEVGVKRITNIYWAYEGDNQTLKEITPIIKNLGGKIVKLSKEEKPLHHIACVFFSNFLVGLISQAQALLVSNKNSQSIKPYLPLIMGTLENILSTTTATNALTGPLIRQDINILKHHITTLQNHPYILYCYKQHSKMLLELVREKFSKDSYKELEKLFQ